MFQDEFFDEFEENNLLEDGDASSHSKYIEVKNEDGTSKTIRKSTFLWMLSESKGKLSSDRLKRVQEGKEEKSKRRRIDVATSSGFDSSTLVSEIRLNKSKEIEIGDWCFFKRPVLSVEHLSKQNIFENCVLGCIIAFKYITTGIANENTRATPITPSIHL